MDKKRYDKRKGVRFRHLLAARADAALTLSVQHSMSSESSVDDDEVNLAAATCGPAVELSKRSLRSTTPEEQLEIWRKRDKESRRVARGVCAECHKDVFTDQYREFHDSTYFHRECYAKKAACMFLAALRSQLVPADIASPADAISPPTLATDTHGATRLVPPTATAAQAEDEHAVEHEGVAEDEHADEQDEHADEHEKVQTEVATTALREATQAATQNGIEDDPACATPLERTNSALIDEAPGMVTELQAALALSVADLKELSNHNSSLHIQLKSFERVISEERRTQEMLQRELDKGREERVTLSEDLDAVRAEKEKESKDLQSAAKELVRCQMRLQQARKAAQLVCDELRWLDTELTVTREEANELVNFFKVSSWFYIKTGH